MKDWPFGFEIPGGAPRVIGNKQSVSNRYQCTDYEYEQPFTRANALENFLQSTSQGNRKLYGRAKWHPHLQRKATSFHCALSTKPCTPFSQYELALPRHCYNFVMVSVYPASSDLVHLYRDKSSRQFQLALDSFPFFWRSSLFGGR